MASQSTLTRPHSADDALLQELGGSDAIRSILDVVCQTTGMGFAAVAHVTETRWFACQVRDDIALGIAAGCELPIETTLCDTVRGTGEPIVIDEVACDPTYCDHCTLHTYGVQSYISVPITLDDGEIFGTLFAIDLQPRRLDTPEIRGMFTLFARLIATQIDRFGANASNETLKKRVADVLAQKKVYADIIESSPASVTALDLDWHILAINQSNVESFQRVYGKHPEVGDDFLSLFDDAPEYQEQQRAIWSRALNGETFVIVQEFGDERIERHYYEVRFNPLRNDQGERIGASSTSYDVTDKVQAETQLAAAQEQLRHALKLEAMGQLTGGVAHDFNNLLTPIVGSLEILKRRQQIGEREQRLLAAAALSAERARTLVQRLLAFARRQPLQPTPVDVGILVAGMSELIGSTTGPQITVAVDIARDLPPAHADPNQLEMALLNLCVNARDAMPKGGILRITATAKTIGPIHRTGLPPGRYVRLSVADTGVGMDEATLARAIEPFFSTKGIGKGTGLGLSMVDGLARQLGGMVTIQSQLGHGTQIDLWLPASAPVPKSRDAQAAGTERGAGLVLLVDDEDLVRMSVAEMLIDLGYQVIEVSSAAQALDHLRSGTSPDIVVTDHLMPGMTGTDLASILATEHPGISPLLISGYAEVAGIGSEFTILTKPFTSEELATSLASLR